MEKLTVNQIHNKYAPKIPFSKWVDFENKLYHELKPKFREPMKFETWINNRYQSGMVNADGLFDTITNIADTAANAIAPKTTTPTTTAQAAALAAQAAATKAAQTDTRIFGLQPIAFYGIVLVIILGTGFGIYTLIKKSKK
jgi:hypothetical protein